MDKKLLAILVCPICKGDLTYDKQAEELICPIDKLAFPVKDDIPIMLEEEARQLAEDEVS
ncbi:MAG: Trm112 family protein [Pseudomonadales bacterium]|nr:Trm112 family protein [Pseudomonadales bacterium]